jgi:integrase
MPKANLTDRFCQTAKTQEGWDRSEYFDTIVRGLSLVVFAGGTRTFFQHYTDPVTNKRQRLKLGIYGDITLAEAREKAREGRGSVAEGKGPVAEKRAAEAAMTVADLVEVYLSKGCSTKRSSREIARRLRKSVVPVIGAIKLADLHRRDVTRAIDKLVDRGVGVEANRTFEDIRACLRWGRKRGDIDTDICGGMEKPTKVEPRTRVLSEDEIRTMWEALPAADMREGTRRIIRLCLVLGQRVGEVSGMTTAELDLDAKLWTIPAARSKNAKEHRVPLSKMAMDIIGAQLADNEALAERKGRKPSGRVFPGPGDRGSITNFAVAKALLRQSKEGKILDCAPFTCDQQRQPSWNRCAGCFTWLTSSVTFLSRKAASPASTTATTATRKKSVKPSIYGPTG